MVKLKLLASVFKATHYHLWAQSINIHAKDFFFKNGISRFCQAGLNRLVVIIKKWKRTKGDRVRGGKVHCLTVNHLRGEDVGVEADGRGGIRYLGWLWVSLYCRPAPFGVCRPSLGRWWPSEGRRLAESGTAARRPRPPCAWCWASPPSCTCCRRRTE